MNKFVRVLPFAVVALLLMPESLLSEDLSFLTGGAPSPCTHRGWTDDQMECDRSESSIPCDTTLARCYGQPDGTGDYYCNVGGDPEAVCKNLSKCLPTHPDTYTLNCTVPPSAP